MNKSLLTLGLAALVAAPFSAFAEVAGEGTAENPYQIATPDDLCNAYKLTKSGEMVYFVQTADLDMSGVTDYIPVVGYDTATYDRPLNYDGRNHVIANFKPTRDVWDSSQMYNYGQSIFGVFSGELKNLGIVDVTLSANGGRGGAIGGYLGQTQSGVEVTKVSNVYVTGKIYAGSNYMGGLFGTTGTAVELNNCFVNVEADGADGALVGCLAGRLNHPNTINNCYVAGSVNGSAKLVCAANAGATTLNGFVVFATGSEELGLTNAAGATLANTTATQQAGIDVVKGWAAYSATEEVNGLPALKYALGGSGTAADPYQIGSVEDLCNAWTVVDCSGGDFHFVQTADIDMDGVEEYHAIAGYNGEYKAIIHYDGQNHIISNFAPSVDAPDTALNNYYCTTVFGVASGEIKNLGVVNAYCANSYQGNGILGAYAGHSTGSALSLENVFVQGDVVYDGEGNYNGGMFGTTGAELTLDNCFANVNVSAAAAGTYNAGLVGRLRNDLNLTSVYVAGSVSGGTNALVVSTDGKTVKVNAFQAIAFNEGSDVALASTLVVGDEDIEIATPETKDMLIQDVRDWRGGMYSLTKDFMGYPALEAFEDYAAGIFDTTVEEVEANGPAVYYNLQGVQVANPDNGIYIVRRGNKVTKELIRK